MHGHTSPLTTPFRSDRGCAASLAVRLLTLPYLRLTAAGAMLEDGPWHRLAARDLFSDSVQAGQDARRCIC
jgi:hypothetical protein